MKSGILGITDSEFQPLSDTVRTHEVSDQELQSAIEITESYYDTSGDLIAQEGHAAMESLDSQESIEIDEEGISSREKKYIDTNYTEFVVSPDGFLTVSSKSGQFLFDLVSDYSEKIVERAEIGLDQFARDHEEAEPWKIGFYGKSGNAENGVIHGNEVWDDSEIGEILQSLRKNQLGLDYEWRDSEIKMIATESGYVEVYQPSSMSTKQYVQYINSEVLPYVR